VAKSLVDSRLLFIINSILWEDRKSHPTQAYWLSTKMKNRSKRLKQLEVKENNGTQEKKKRQEERI